MVNCDEEPTETCALGAQVTVALDHYSSDDGWDVGWINLIIIIYVLKRTSSGLLILSSDGLVWAENQMASILVLKKKKKSLISYSHRTDTAENEMQSLTVCWIMLIVKYRASSWSPLQRVVKMEIALFLILQGKHSVTKHAAICWDFCRCSLSGYYWVF